MRQENPSLLRLPPVAKLPPLERNQSGSAEAGMYLPLWRGPCLLPGTGGTVSHPKPLPKSDPGCSYEAVPAAPASSRLAAAAGSPLHVTHLAAPPWPRLPQNDPHGNALGSRQHRLGTGACPVPPPGTHSPPPPNIAFPEARRPICHAQV